MLLPDTSIWVAFLRPGSAELTQELTHLLDRGEVMVCGPVLAELVAGASPPDRAALLSSLAGLPWADIGRSEWHAVGLAAAELRAAGGPSPSPTSRSPSPRARRTPCSGQQTATSNGWCT